MPTRTRRRPAFGVQPRQFRRAPPPKSDSNLKRRVGAAFRRRRSMCAVHHISLAGLACPMRGMQYAALVLISTVTNPWAQPTAWPRCPACRGALPARVKRPCRPRQATLPPASSDRLKLRIAPVANDRPLPCLPWSADGRKGEKENIQHTTYNSMQQDRRRPSRKKVQAKRSAEKVARRENSNTGRRQSVSTVRIYRASAVSPPSHRRNRSEGRYLVS